MCAAFATVPTYTATAPQAQVAGTLLVRGHERSERVAQAMRCRGFDREFRSLNHFRTTWPDVLAFLGFVGYAGGPVAWDCWMR